MPYIGYNVTNAGSFAMIDDISSTFNGSNTSFTLNVGGVNITPNTANLLIAIDGVVQQAPDAYTVSGSTINFTGAPASGADFYGILMGQSSYVENNSIGADELNVSGDGTSLQVLTSDGDGTFSWVSQSALTPSANLVTGNTLKSTVTASSLTSVGTLTGLTIENGTNPLVVGDGTKDLYFDPDSNGVMVSTATSQGGDGHYYNDASGEVWTTIDGTAKVKVKASAFEVTPDATFAGDIKNSSDSKSIYVGASDDLRIVHDGSNSYIDHENTGDLKIRSRRHNGDIRFYNENSSGTETLTLQLTGASNANFAGDITISKGGALFNLQEPSGSQAYLYSGGSFTALRTTSSHPLHFSANYSSGDDSLVIGTDKSVTAIGTLHVKNSSSTSSGIEVGCGAGDFKLFAFNSTHTTNGAFVSDGATVDADDNLSGGLSVMSRHASGEIRFYTGGYADGYKRMSINSAGYVTKPNHPTFHAYGFSGNNHIYANSSDKDPIKYINTHNNVGSHYDNSTGRFTAPVAGTYYFYMGAMYKHIDGDFHITIKVNGNAKTISNNHQEKGTDLHDWVHTNCHLTYTLAKDDYITFQFDSSSNSSTYLYGAGQYNHAGGYLIG